LKREFFSSLPCQRQFPLPPFPFIHLTDSLPQVFPVDHETGMALLFGGPSPLPFKVIFSQTTSLRMPTPPPPPFAAFLSLPPPLPFGLFRLGRTRCDATIPLPGWVFFCGMATSSIPLPHERVREPSPRSLPFGAPCLVIPASLSLLFHAGLKYLRGVSFLFLGEVSTLPHCGYCRFSPLFFLFLVSAERWKIAVPGPLLFPRSWVLIFFVFGFRI